MNSSTSLDGRWTLHLGDTPDGTPSRLGTLPQHTVEVPGLWEAQGFLHLDGTAWYTRTFDLEDAQGRWRLHFGAVMDSAEVWLNGTCVGGQELQPFTPFDLDVTDQVRPGRNSLAVRVHDPAADDPGVLRSAHGKQGWANDVFPSPPSLYATYGGIWQPVELRQHGPVTIEDVFVQPDPENLVLLVELASTAATPANGTVAVSAAGLAARRTVALSAGEPTVVRFELGRTDAALWRPEDPVLHTADVRFCGDRDAGARWSGRFGLRTVRAEAGRILLNGQPLRMRSVLVQGFWPGTLYGAGGREAIRAEVEAAREAGFNTLRLHVKAFEPEYLDLCDELGMLLHCDMPVAEPIAHTDLGEDTELARRCEESLRAQVRRDRNHPSVILWSAMNEIGLPHPEVRRTPEYEKFARKLVSVIRSEDPTRLVIENDWIEPDPDFVFEGDLTTAHWYGRLQHDYLEELNQKTASQAGHGRPLLVSEFGDWGLPDLSAGAEAGFWDQSASLAQEISSTAWGGTPQEFVEATQRYQGLSDRLQGEVFRRNDHVAGYCLTELTDVPHELNGILDFGRRPKMPALAEIRRLNQTVLPMARTGSFTAQAADTVAVRLSISNDGPRLDDLTLVAELGGVAAAARHIPTLGAHAVTDLGSADLPAPARPGQCELRLSLRRGERTLASNSYPLWIVAPQAAELSVRLVGTGPTEHALDRLGIGASGPGPLVVAEGALDCRTAAAVREALRAGETVVILHQDPESSAHWPLPVRLVPARPEWGPTVFQFTSSGLPWDSLPAGRLLTTEHCAIEGSAILAAPEGSPLDRAEVLVGAYKPPPEPLGGAVVCSLDVGAGRLVACQLKLAEAAVAGDPGAAAVLGDLLAWAAR